MVKRIVRTGGKTARPVPRREPRRTKRNYIGLPTPETNVPVREQLRIRVAATVQRQPGKRSRDGATNGQGDRRNTTKEAKPLAPVRAPVSGDGERSFAPREEAQGKATRLMAPTACVDFQAFSGELRNWEEGVPVDCGDPWAWETIEAAVEKGAHKSATSDESIALVKEDVAYQVLEGTAQAAPEAVKNIGTCRCPTEKPKGTHDSGPLLRGKFSQGHHLGHRPTGEERTTAGKGATTTSSKPQ